MRSKQDRRLYYRGLQNSFSEQQYRIWNEGLVSPLQEILSKTPKNSLIAAYQAKSKEAQLDSLFGQPFRFCFPKVISPQEALMEFREVKKPGDGTQFDLGAYGIREPKASCPMVTKEKIQVVLVPLLAFDAQGRRLGQGKGFYDRFLENFKGLKIGVAFEWQYSPNPLPVDKNDQILDLVVTEHCLRHFHAAHK